jgi:hypothetical protein
VRSGLLGFNGRPDGKQSRTRGVEHRIVRPIAGIVCKPVFEQ